MGDEAEMSAPNEPTGTWRPIESAPQGVMLLCRSGATLVFASAYRGHWTDQRGGTVQPREWWDEDVEETK